MAVLKYYDPVTHAYRPLDILIAEGGDKTYETTFTTSTQVTVQHFLGKYPAVVVIDSSGEEVEGEIHHLSKDILTVSFSAAFSGKVICN